MQQYKIHIFRPNDNLKSLILNLKHIDGVEGFVEDYAFTADHGDRSSAAEITERAKQVFLIDMAVNYPDFFKALGFHRRSATSIVDELWDYLEFENYGDMGKIWSHSGKRFKEFSNELDFIDYESLVV